MDWQLIDTAPKDEKRLDSNIYGPWILAYPIFGGVGMCRWWEAIGEEYERYRNFLEPGGNAVHPTHWMPLPTPPHAKSA